MDSSLGLLEQKIENAISSIEFLEDRAEVLRKIAYLILNRVQKVKND